MSYQQDTQADELSDKEFLSKYKNIFYKTSNINTEKRQSDVKNDVNMGLNGMFTSH